MKALLRKANVPNAVAVTAGGTYALGLLAYFGLLFNIIVGWYSPETQIGIWTSALGGFAMVVLLKDLKWSTRKDGREPHVALTLLAPFIHGLRALWVMFLLQYII